MKIDKSHYTNPNEIDEIKVTKSFNLISFGVNNMIKHIFI